jgi:hypothetical protein
MKYGSTSAYQVVIVVIPCGIVEPDRTLTASVQNNAFDEIVGERLAWFVVSLPISIFNL